MHGDEVWLTGRFLCRSPHHTGKIIPLWQFPGVWGEMSYWNRNRGKLWKPKVLITCPTAATVSQDAILICGIRDTFVQFHNGLKMEIIIMNEMKSCRSGREMKQAETNTKLKLQWTSVHLFLLTYCSPSCTQERLTICCSFSLQREKEERNCSFSPSSAAFGKGVALKAAISGFWLNQLSLFKGTKWLRFKSQRLESLFKPESGVLFRIKHSSHSFSSSSFTLLAVLASSDRCALCPAHTQPTDWGRASLCV